MVRSRSILVISWCIREIGFGTFVRLGLALKVAVFVGTRPVDVV